MSGPQLCKEAEGLMRAAREAALPPVWELEPGEARQRLHGTFTGAPVADELVEVSDVGLPAWVVGAPFYRRYVPDQPQDDTVVLFFHGGGWVVNSVATHDNLCRRLAGRGNVEVLSLEYPLAPEYPYPAAINAGAQWIAFLMAERSISDETRIIVAGDSSGASVGLALAQRSYMGDRISACISLYPAVAHYTRSFGSYGERGSGYNLTSNWMKWFWDYYVSPNTVRTAAVLDSLLEPLYGDYPREVQHFVLTAEFDPLRDEGAALVAHLREGGAHVEHAHFDDQMHGFIMVPHLIPAGFDAIDGVVEFLTEL